MQCSDGGVTIRCNCTSEFATNDASDRNKTNALFRPVHVQVYSTVRAFCLSLAYSYTGFDVSILAH